jgi:FMN phosphatase YigB (HAD superfamily)
VNDDLSALVRGVTLLSLDAGNTVIFLDHARLARLLAAHGFATNAGALVVAEGAAKRRHVSATMEEVAWRRAELPGARGWGAMVATIAAEAGFPRARLSELVDDLWDEHVRVNLWNCVPDGFGPAIEAARARGVKVVLVSNSEGMLQRLFDELDIARHFDLLLDSGVVGLEKPDPRFFHVALDRFGVAPDAAIHLGDMYSTDILGARAAKMRTALVDPYGHYEGMFADVPRVPGAVEVAIALGRGHVL